jgi:hypothetical protein
VLSVVCFFWQDEQRAEVRSAVPTPEEVRIWDSMIARNLTVPHRRICVTHRPDLLEHFIECIPIDPAKHVPGTCLVKLQAHKPGGVAKEGDRVLLMDIDCVVTGNLDPLVSPPYSMMFWKNPNYEAGGRRGFIQGSMQLFTVGATEFLWADFDPKSTMSWLNRRFGGKEQCWISERLNVDYPNAGWEWVVPHWTEKWGVYGRGRLFNGKMGAGVQTELPANARIVFFPGNRSPSEPEAQAESPWIKEFYR